MLRYPDFLIYISVFILIHNYFIIRIPQNWLLSEFQFCFIKNKINTTHSFTYSSAIFVSVYTALRKVFAQKQTRNLGFDMEIAGLYMNDKFKPGMKIWGKSSIVLNF
jgi:purine-nucleoside phosphorylase